MKSINQPSDKLLAKLFLLCLVGIGFLLAPTPIAAQANLQKAIDRYIEKVREDADEYKEARKIIYGDVDGDGTKDAVVQYTLEGAGGGNSWGQSLVVFLNKKLNNLSVTERFGLFRFEIVSANYNILSKTLCCIDSKTSNNKLIEKFSGGNYFEFRHYFLQKRIVADVVSNDETFVHKRTAGNQSVVLQSG